MRLRNWIAVIVSVILLAAAGTIGFLVNRSALRAADAVHRADTTALGANNATLTGQLQLLSAKDLDAFAESQTFSLSAGNSGDRATLQAFAAKSGTFSYGVLLTNLAGTVLNGSRDTGLPPATDPVEALRRLAEGFRQFILANPVLAEVMFSRPFADFEPGPDELAAGSAVREIFVGRIQRCVDKGLLSGDPNDMAHVLLALAQGLAVQEAGRWLGSGQLIERRWKLGVTSLLAGLR